MKYLIIVFVILCAVNNVMGQTCTAVGDGPWTTDATWSCTGGPLQPDDGTIIANILIPSGFTVSVGTNAYTGQISVYGSLNIIFGTLTMGGGSTIDIFTGGNLGYFFGQVIVGGGTPVGGFAGGEPGPQTIDESGAGPLPIDLISFVARNVSSSTKLDWETASEFNFDFFEIQRAIGSTDFKQIGKVPGAGEDVETIRTYEFIDEKPLNGINYYRLKSIDLDGTFEYSDIQAVKHAFDSRFDIYPNPSSGTTLNVLMDEVEEGYQIVVYDNMGLQVYESIITGHDESYTLPNLKSGVYTIKLLGRGDNPVQKLVVY